MTVRWKRVSVASRRQVNIGCCGGKHKRLGEARAQFIRSTRAYSHSIPLQVNGSRRRHIAQSYMIIWRASFISRTLATAKRLRRIKFGDERLRQRDCYALSVGWRMRIFHPLKAGYNLSGGKCRRSSSAAHAHIATTFRCKSTRRADTALRHLTRTTILLWGAARRGRMAAR